SFNASRLRCPFPNRRESYRRCSDVSNVREWIAEQLSFGQVEDEEVRLRLQRRHSSTCTPATSNSEDLLQLPGPLGRDQRSPSFFTSPIIDRTISLGPLPTTVGTQKTDKEVHVLSTASATSVFDQNLHSSGAHQGE